MNPTFAQLHVNSLLTTMSIGFEQDASGFIADRVFPMLNVAKRADRFASLMLAGARSGGEVLKAKCPGHAAGTDKRTA